MAHEQTRQAVCVCVCACAPFLAAVTMATVADRGHPHHQGAVWAAQHGVALAANPGASCNTHTHTTHTDVVATHTHTDVVATHSKKRHMCHAAKHR